MVFCKEEIFSPSPAASLISTCSVSCFRASSHDASRCASRGLDKGKVLLSCDTRPVGKKRSHNVQIARGAAGLSEQRRPRSEGTWDMLSCRQAEEGCEGFGDAEQLDGDLASRWSARIASQPFLPTEAIMRPLRTGKRRRRGIRAHGERLLSLHLEVLAAQRQARTSMVPTTPVTPAERFRPDDEWMQQHAHLAGLGGGAALPLTLLSASGRGGNCGCWPHRPCAGSHRLLGVERRPQATGRRGNAACHPAGGESLDPRSGFVSRANPPGGSIARGGSRVRRGRRGG